MLIVFKIVLVAFAVFGQAKLFPEHPASAASSLDSVDLSVEKPELVLAHRAMEAQGLCPSSEKEPEEKQAVAKDTAVAPVTRVVPLKRLAGNCE
jgi:hypothetical protein